MQENRRDAALAACGLSHAHACTVHGRRAYLFTQGAAV